MTNPIHSQKKKLTLIATLEGLALAEKALIRLGFESKSNFAKTQLLARSTVTRFFQGEPIQLDSFKRICEALKLNWQEITEGLTEEKQLERLTISEHSSLKTNEGVKQVKTLSRQITVVDERMQNTKAVIVLDGDIESVQNQKILESILREYSGDTIKIVDIKQGSIQLIVEGSQEDIERLITRFRAGEIKKLSSFPVEDIQILGESSDDTWDLVRKITSNSIEDRNLSDADLRGTNLSEAKVSYARFGYNKGISESMRDDLIRRGAIFEDSSGDRSPIHA